MKPPDIIGGQNLSAGGEQIVQTATAMN